MFCIKAIKLAKFFCLKILALVSLKIIAAMKKICFFVVTLLKIFPLYPIIVQILIEGFRIEKIQEIPKESFFDKRLFCLL